MWEAFWYLVKYILLAVFLGSLGGLLWLWRKAGALKPVGFGFSAVALLAVTLVSGFLFYFLFGAVYEYSVSYPAAVYTEDGSKIVFLEHRALGVSGLVWKTSAQLESKTYLGVMDRDGRGKKILMVHRMEGMGVNPHYVLERYGDGVPKEEAHRYNEMINTEITTSGAGSFPSAMEVLPRLLDDKSLYSIARGRTDKLGRPLPEWRKTRESYFFRPPWWKL